MAAGASARREHPADFAPLDLSLYLRFILALAAVLAMIGAAAYLVRRFGLFGAGPGRRGGDRRLSVSAAQPLDNRRRLMLVRRDGVEHLLLVGGPNDLVVETGIQPPAPASAPALLPASDRP
jgi:flagellar protein FliO/FliZ